QNLQADPRTSLLITQVSPTGESGDPLAASRLTLMGEARRLDGHDVAPARQAYLARHARAAYWVDFDAFSFWRIDVTDIYFVGGFAATDRATTAVDTAARPGPLSDAATGLMDHMNRDHADALVAYARHFAAEPADSSTIVAVA